MSRGFSLLEGLLAFAFLALAALALISTLIFSNRLDTKQEARQKAALLALDLMEEARAQMTRDYGFDLTLELAPHPEDDRFVVRRSQSFVGTTYGLENAALKEVTVEATWADAQGSQSYRLTERFARP